MIPLTTIPREEVEWVHVSSHYDIHLSGLCRYGGALCHAEIHDEGEWDDDAERYIRPTTYRIFALSPLALALRLWRMKLFQWCVGYHWTYPHRPNRERFRMRRWGYLSQFLFGAYYVRPRDFTSWRRLKALFL